MEFANQLRDQGRGIREAVVEAAELRLRPILMTTGAMVLGAIPLARAVGRRRREPSGDWLGDRRWHDPAPCWTLFVVPTAYTLLARERGERARKWQERNSSHISPRIWPGSSALTELA